MKSSSLALMALAALGGATALYFTVRAPAPPPAPSPTNALAAGPSTGARNPDPGRLPSISITGGSGEVAERPSSPGAAARPGEPAPGTATGDPAEQVARLERRLEELEGRLAAATASAAGRPIGSPFPAGIDAPIPASKAAPTILPGSENNPEGPVLYDPGPPWPYNEGARGVDPPAVPGAGCLTCSPDDAPK